MSNRPVRLLLFALALALVAPNAAADANSLNDYFGPRVISVGEVGRADSRGAESTTLNPAGLALTRQVVFEGSYGYRPGDGASLINASACDSTVPVSGCFYYRYFEASPEVGDNTFERSAHEFGSSLARALTQNILIGLNMRYFSYNDQVSADGDTSGFTFDAGAIVRPASIVQVGVVGYNLMPKDSAQYPTAIGAGLSLRPGSSLGIGVDGLWDLDDDAELGTTGRYGVGAEYFLAAKDQQSGYPLRVGGIYDKPLESSYVTGGIGFLNAKVGLDIGFRKQVDGGDELMIQAGLRLFGPAVR